MYFPKSKREFMRCSDEELDEIAGFYEVGRVARDDVRERVLEYLGVWG